LLGADPTKAFAIQGFGNAGQRAALLHREILGGGKLVAVSDSRGALFAPEGMDPEELVMHKLKTGSVLGFPGAKVIPHEALLELDVEVLYPAALENVITAANAPNIKARIICELANGPTTPEADIILNRKGIHVIPDILASAGGVTVSYFEMVQDSYSWFWDEELVHARLDSKLTRAYRTVQEAVREKKVHPRLGRWWSGLRAWQRRQSCGGGCSGKHAEDQRWNIPTVLALSITLVLISCPHSSTVENGPTWSDSTLRAWTVIAYSWGPEFL
jgi:glutamate dehydrogenase (NAD(P)+)